MIISFLILQKERLPQLLHNIDLSEDWYKDVSYNSY